MLKERARAIAAGLFCGDLFIIVVGFVLAHRIRSDGLTHAGWFLQPLYPLSTYLPLLPIALVLAAVCLIVGHRYRAHRTVPLATELWGLATSTAVWSALLVLTIFLFQLDSVLFGNDRISRTWIVLFAVSSWMMQAALRGVVRSVSRRTRARGYNYRTVLIVGTNNTARAILHSIDSHRDWGLRIGGLISDDLPRGEMFTADYRVVGNSSEIVDIATREVVDEVIFAVDPNRLHQLEGVFLSLQDLGVLTRFAIHPFPHAQASLEVDELDGVPVISFSSGPTDLLKLLTKRATDIFVSFGALLVISPLLLLIAVATKLSGGPVLFTQTRCGLNGRRFRLFKFRTMVEDAESMQQELAHLNQMDGPVFKMKNDPRVTKLGRLLRRYSLDELPQLWNVLFGDMSLVGPRPPLPDEVDKYELWQRRRLSMRPGLTCLWQVSGRNEVDFDRWIELDLEYIDAWSPLLDFKILAKTIPVVLSGRGAF